jgi:DNA repair protein RecO (recombination protein O)
MLEKDEGVVLKVNRSGESSLLVTFLGRTMGKVRLMAKGVMSPKRSSRGLFEPGNHLEIVFYHGAGRALFYIKEASALSSPLAGRDSLPQMASGLAVVELLDQVCYAGSADEAVVDLAIEYVRTDKGRDPLLLFLAFQAKLLYALGVFPEMRRCARCDAPITGGGYSANEGASYCHQHAKEVQQTLPLTSEVLAAFDRCLVESLSELNNLEVSREVRKDLGKIIHWTYTYHVQGYSLPKSLRLI